MMLINRRAFLVAGGVTILALGAMGGYGYHAFVAGAPLTNGSYVGQEFLYVTLLLVVLVILLFLRIYLRSRNIGRELDKLIEVTRYRGLSSAQNLNRLGPIGTQIAELYEHLNALSERKSLKISSLAELSEFLMNNVAVPALVATVDGKVVYVSRVFTERTKRSKNEVIESRIEEQAPGVDFSDVVAELDRTHSTIERKGERTAFTFYPVRNGSNQLAYIVCVFQGNAGLVEQARHHVSETAPAPVGRMWRLLNLGRNAARRLARGGEGTPTDSAQK